METLSMSGDVVPFDPGCQIQDDLISAAVASVLGRQPIDFHTEVVGGASGATLHRYDAGDRRLLVRLEGPSSTLLKRNPHRFAVMRSAADAGVAPPVHYVDEPAGLTVTDFVLHQPLAGYPGGPVTLARALGDLRRRLQGEAQFPPLVDYRELVAGMLAHLTAADLFTKEALEPHVVELAKLVGNLDWEARNLVASHNDPNPTNILFDGERLWLIDWEAGYANDPMVDLGIISEAFAPEGDLLDALLKAWLGHHRLDSLQRNRFTAVRRLTRLYYACFLLEAGAKGPLKSTDVEPLTPWELRARLLDGRLKPGSREAALEFGKVYLGGFLTGVIPPGLREAGAAAALA